VIVEVSMEGYQVLLGEKWGLDMGLTCQFCAKAGPDDQLITGSELGLGAEDFVTLEDAWKAMDWTSL
jgi:hypothetical protein